MTWQLVVGPPGTGKTTTLLSLFADKIAAGHQATDIAYVSFTRAARAEVWKRLGEQYGTTKDDYPWIRTIHSMAMRLLGIKPGQLMKARHWAKFTEETGFDFSPPDEGPTDGDDVLASATTMRGDDIIKGAHEWGRSRMLDVDQTLRAFPGQIDGPRLIEYSEAIRQFKDRESRVDFMDLLELALDDTSRPNVSVAFVDEAQDLSPIQQRLAEKWFGDCRDVYVAGDDDQAIYEFQGADPSWMLGLAARGDVKTQVLTKSYRVPSKVLEFSRAIIRRNRERIEKDYEPARLGGSVSSALLEDALNSADGPVFVLSRNKSFLADPAQLLFDRRVPFVAERWARKMRNPYGSAKTVEAFRGCLAIAEGSGIYASQLAAVLEKIPSMDMVGGEKIRLLPHGVKKKVKDLRAGLGLTTSDLFDLGLHELVDNAACGRPFAMLRNITPGTRGYFQDVFARHGGIPKPKVTLTTIHGSKGREADTVVLLSDMAKASYREYNSGGQQGFEAENRVAYVGASRTRDRLVVVEPQSRLFYDYPPIGT